MFYSEKFRQLLVTRSDLPAVSSIKLNDKMMI